MVVLSTSCEGLIVEGRNKFDAVKIDHHLALMGEVHSDPSIHVALHLSDPPIGLIGMGNKCAGREKG